MSTAVVHYLAYGSNLHPYRLQQRVPSAEFLGIVALPGKQLTFHKLSRDGSAKCMFVDSAAAAHKLYGAVYSLDARERAVLDEIEGVGLGYDAQNLRASLDGVDYDAFTYAAAATHVRPDLRPFHWYKELVLLGAQYHGLPDDYVAAIAGIESITDPDADRSREKVALLDTMRDINRGA